MLGRNGCSSGALDVSKYSSPVPMIGLYVAGGTLVCFFLMLLDIFAAIRNKKLWIPVKYFSLHSVTLTLLSIAAKIPVDLTTPMPRGLDQLAKLTGTTFICIFMGFIMHSLGKVGKSESLSNMIALTIFIVTVFGNICTQIFTGLIFSFIIEHIIILCIMLVLLGLLWTCALESSLQKGSPYVDLNKELFLNGKDSFLERLEMCHVHGYKTNPQFYLSLIFESANTSIICIFCVVILTQAAVRTLTLKDSKFCKEEDSDYRWSMWIIVYTQILFVIVGGLSTYFRGLSSHYFFYLTKDEARSIIISSPILGWSSLDICVNILKELIYLAYTATMLLFKSPILVLFVISMMIKGCCGIFVRKKNKGSRTMEEFKDLISGESDKETEEWALKKGIMDMETVMEEGRRDPPIDLIKLFSQTPPSEVSLSSHLNLSKDHRLLSMILLVRIAMVSAPNPLGEILFRSLSEAYEVIGFVDRRLSSSSSNSRTKSKIVKAAWQYMKNEDFSTGNELMSQSPSLGAIKELRDKMPKDIVSEELDILVNLIEIRACASNEELYNFIKQIFVDLLHEVLKELPNIIFFYVIESPVEEYESRVSRVMKFVCKIELLGTRVSWVFPKDTNILCLVAPEVPTPSSHSISIVEGDNTLNGVDDDLRLLEVTIVHVNQPEDI